MDISWLGVSIDFSWTIKKLYLNRSLERYLVAFFYSGVIYVADKALVWSLDWVVNGSNKCDRHEKLLKILIDGMDCFGN